MEAGSDLIFLLVISVCRLPLCTTGTAKQIVTLAYIKHLHMKQLIFFLAFITISLRSPAQGVTASPENLKKLDWLTGTWMRIDVKPGRAGSERWVKLSPSEWQGWGVAMRGNDTSFVEKLRIIAKDKLIFYVADIKENKNTVYFQFVALGDDHFRL